MAIWDDYLNSQYSGAAADAAKSAAIGQKAPPVTTSGNKAWRDAQNPEPQPEPSIPPAIPPIKPTPTPYQPTQLPAVNQALQPNRNTAFARNAPINTIAQNLAAQIPIGGFGLGLGYGSQQMNIGDFMNPSTQQQPTLSGYKWSKGTGGLTGGNNAQANYFFNDGTAFSGPANSQYDLPRLGGTIDQQPGLGALQTTQQAQQSMLDSATSNAQSYGGGGILPSWNSPTGGQVDLTGYGPRQPDLRDLSVGSLANANRYTSQGVPAQGAGANYLPAIKAGYRVTESPTGQGMMIAGPSRTVNAPIPKPNRLSGDYTGQKWQLGNWY